MSAVKTLENKTKSGFFAPPLNNSTSKSGFANLAKLIINDRFIISDVYCCSDFKSIIKYKIYKGIDTQAKKYVIIYAFPIAKPQITKSKGGKKGLKEQLKQKIVPQTIWKGSQKIDNNMFSFEVHQKLGPSLAQIMKIYHKKISDKTLYILSYQLLKLIDKIDNAGYCVRNLSPSNLILSQIATKTNIFLLNDFDLQKKGEDYFAIPNKYSSIGCSLKLKNSPKDMVESMCYVLIDFYLEGKLFQDGCKTQDFFEPKSILCPDYMPYHFLEFYNYVKNINRSEEIRFSEWKLFFKKIIGPDLMEPYEWIKVHTELTKKGMLKNLKMNKIESTPVKLKEISQNECDSQKKSYISEDMQSLRYEIQELNKISEHEETEEELEQYSEEDSIQQKIPEFYLKTYLFTDSKKYL